MAERDEGPDPGFLALQEALAGRYSIQRELGRGGMGVVYLAQEVRLERAVALKVLPPELAAQSTFRERFLREARTAAQLSHPHIVPVHAVDEVGDFVFFAMAYVAGETLGERVRGRGPLSPTEATRVLKEVAWALGYAHAQGVVHRDVKPDNIMLEAGTGRAVVTDFGIARATQAGEGMTGHGEFLGTAEFMSPEQASGEEIDGRSDIYALGVVGHYVLTGRLPFQGDTIAATLAQQMTKPAPALHSVAPEVPVALARALDRCLAKNPDARPANGEELAAALGGALERKREVPIPIRAFLEETQAQGITLASSVGFGLYTTLITAVGLADGLSGGGDMPMWALGALGSFGLGFIFLPAGILVRKARALLRSGHQADEVVRVLTDEVEERRRALATGPADESSRLDRWLKRLFWGGSLTFAGGFAWLGWGPYTTDPLFWTAFWAVMPASALALFGGGFLSALREDRVRGIRGQRWLRIWEGPLGRALFGLAGIGMEESVAAGPGYRPTAVAIGMAADRLFRALPTGLQEEFDELPAVVDALEASADGVRAQIAVLDAALAEAAPEGRMAEGAGNRRVVEEIEASRAEAEARLQAVVGAMESLRLQLIRLGAGLGTAEQLTARLDTARALAVDIGRVADGAKEVDRLLGIERPLEHADTPTPAGGAG